jgi:peptidoglycan/xylan/chitin deacetylase (PgdA/CDA1 family)
LKHLLNFDCVFAALRLCVELRPAKAVTSGANVKLCSPILLVVSCALAFAASVAGQETREGGLIRGPTSSRQIALVFTGHEFAEGGSAILDELAKHKGKGSFFVTGDFLANTNFAALMRRIVNEGHYLGPHSDKHVLYCPWEGVKKTLVTRDQFRADLESNLNKIEAFGVSRREIRYFLPPFEHYNEEIAAWSKELGLTLVNYTPGTRSNADYTGERDQNFVPTKAIFDSIITKEQQGENGLNGFLLLLHIGTGPGRTDKFHARFGELLDYLAGKGYGFVKVDELLVKVVERTR